MKLENALQAALRKAQLAPPATADRSLHDQATKTAATKLNARYRYRGLPSSCADDANLWAISGHHKPGAGTDFMEGGSGVLEWCFSEEDARRRLKIMSRFDCFEGLSAESWLSIAHPSQVE